MNKQTRFEKWRDEHLTVKDYARWILLGMEGDCDNCPAFVNITRACTDSYGSKRCAASLCAWADEEVVE